MKSTTFALPLLASLAIAQPHKHAHRHPVRYNEARNEPVVKWVTEVEYTTEVIPVTTTIWVSEGFVPPAETTATSSPQYQNTVPAQFFQPVTLSSSTSPSSVPVAPAPVTTSVQPTSAAAPAPSVEQKPDTAPVVVSTPPKVEEVVNTPAPVQTTTSSAPVVSSAPSSGSGGPCSSGSPCEGDITHYDPNVGLGACGWQNDGQTENVVALSHLLMGTQSNGNPYCGKTITVKMNGKSVTAKVVDKCMGCEIHAIDLSEVAFKQLADLGVGRTQVEWSFN